MASNAISLVPTPPNFHVCSAEYGTNLAPSSCWEASAKLDDGTVPLVYAIRSPGQTPFQFSLPISISNDAGTCWISIEVAGPATGSLINITPSDLHLMALLVIDVCVVGVGGIGGFMTGGFSNLINVIVDPTITRNPTSNLPVATQFVTLTVSGPLNRLPKPGNTDPSIPLAVAEALSGAARYRTSYARTISQLEGSLAWIQAAAGMSRGGQTTWWTQASSLDDMTYECDVNLGSPLASECTKIEWNQLGPASVSPPSDTVTVGPGVVHFLHSNSCYLAISATASVVLNWQQIRAAVAALMNICIQPPLQRAQGGRAYNGSPAKVPRRQKRQSPNQITGLNALPMHAEITIFQQQEPWTNAADEIRSCTWTAVQNASSVLKCNA